MSIQLKARISISNSSMLPSESILSMDVRWCVHEKMKLKMKPSVKTGFVEWHLP